MRRTQGDVAYRDAPAPPKPEEAVLWLFLDDTPNGPEIAREMGIEQVLIRHRAIALHSPSFAPRIANDEHSLGIFVPNCNDAVPLGHMFSRVRHRNDSGPGYLAALKTMVNGESEDERKAVRQTALHLRQTLAHAGIRGDKIVLGGSVYRTWGSIRKFVDVVRPHFFGRSADGSDGLDAVADLRTGILRDGSFDGPLIVVDEKARWREHLLALLALIEFDRGRDAVFSGPEASTVRPELLLMVDLP